MLIALIVVGIIFLILVHELGHFLVAKYFRMPVEEFGIGLPPRAWGRRLGETVYSLNWLPFGGFVRIKGEDREPEDLMSLATKEKEKLFMFQAPHRRALVIVAGVAVNFIVGWLLLSLVFMIGTPTLIYIQEVREGGPAALSGVKGNDVITGYGVSFDEVIETNIAADTFIDFVDKRKGEEMVVRVLRGGEELFFNIIPRVNPPEGEGALGIGFTEIGFQSLPIGESLRLGFWRTLEVVVMTFYGLGSLFQGLFTSGEVPEGIVGPVGIFSFAYQSSQIGLVYLVQILGLISLNLAVLNLIPFPALDGGQILFILIEKIKGSPIRTSTKALVNAGGMALLLILIVVVSIRDVWFVIS
ncbi:MAG: site-2 protease family protein [Anaplasmataceae bacterium]|nr:site-2 protease family protein [Anaplasmataceae bacterium]